mmetsp:Transcript_50801/g.132060  ORF Transcript_50801/g.132060 Transcript_50801/m.132060 type:complete len:380 (+) Transcript_50801:83-1222(+)
MTKAMDSGSPRVAVLIVLQDSSDESLANESGILRRVREAALTALKESGLSSAAAQALYTEDICLRCAHWEPAWASARRAAGGTNPPADVAMQQRQSLWACLAWCGSYRGPQDSVSGRAHYTMAQVLSELSEQVGGSAPLVVVAQGLGCLVAEAHFACLAHHAATSPASTCWPEALLSGTTSTPLERGETLHSFWSIGSPIALWLDALKACSECTSEAVWFPKSLAVVPSPKLGSSLPEDILCLGGRRHFWHRYDPLCCTPVTEIYTLGATAQDVEVRLGGNTPPASFDYLKAIEHERRKEPSGARSKREAVIPLGRHLASVLLAQSGQAKEAFDRTVERGRSSTATGTADMSLSSRSISSSIPSSQTSARDGEGPVSVS